MDSEDDEVAKAEPSLVQRVVRSVWTRVVVTLVLLAVVAAQLDWGQMADRLRDGRPLDFAAALGLDLADWWEPTAEAYVNRVPKAQIIAALKEGKGAQEPETRRLVDNADRSIESAHGLLKALLNLSQLEAGRASRRSTPSRPFRTPSCRPPWVET